MASSSGSMRRPVWTDAIHVSCLVPTAAFATLLLDLAATTVLVPLLPTYSSLTAGQTSLVFLCKPVAEMLANLLAVGPSFADHCGPRWPAMLGLLTVAASQTLLIGDTLYVLVTGRVIGGLGASLCVPALLKLVTLTFGAEPKVRDRVIALALAGDALGGVVGPVFGSVFFSLARVLGAGTSAARALPLMVIAGLCLCTATILLCVRNETTRGSSSSSMKPALPLSAILSRRDVWLVAVPGLIFGVTSFQIGLLEPTMPFLLLNLGEADSGYLWAFVGLGFMATAPISIWFVSLLHDLSGGDGATEEGTTGGGGGGGPSSSARKSPAVSPANGAMTAALRYAWASISLGSVLMLVYSVALLVLANRLPASETQPGGPPPSTGWVLGFSVAMTVLGFSLGMTYVPVNTFTQDLTLRLLDESAIARMLGFLQGAKNTGLVLGYIVGPTLLNPMNAGFNAPSGFATLALVLLASAVVVGVTALGLRIVVLQLLPGSSPGESSALLAAGAKEKGGGVA